MSESVKTKFNIERFTVKLDLYRPVQERMAKLCDEAWVNGVGNRLGKEAWIEVCQNDPLQRLLLFEQAICEVLGETLANR